jgi:hypothetical protein
MHWEVTRVWTLLLAESAGLLVPDVSSFPPESNLLDTCLSPTGWKWPSQGNLFHPPDLGWTIDSASHNPIGRVRNIRKIFPMGLFFMRSSSHALPILQGTSSLVCPSQHQTWFPQFQMMTISFDFHLFLSNNVYSSVFIVVPVLFPLLDRINAFKVRDLYVSISLCIPLPQPLTSSLSAY